VSEGQQPPKRLSFDETKERFAQIMRERQALDASYAELMAEMKQQSEATQQAGEKPKLPGEVAAMILRLVNYVNMEREQSNMMFELLVSAYAELAEEYKD
jgi:hypothetical protein